MPIKILAPEVVSQIAAGEIVERPASVVKELLENSLDAGATEIRIQARGGGVELMLLSDNGAGIPPDELELAFHRHATSKIASLADLESSTSLGFRGEALASIAAVAQIDLTTRPATETAGNYISLRNGAVVGKGSRGCPQGTTVVVRNLFQAVPARLKFLRSSNTENSHIADLVTRYSLAFPEVRFVLNLEGREVLHTTGSGRLQDTLAAAYGWETAEAMLRLHYQGGAGEITVAVNGYTSPPSLTRASRSYLSFFVNRRWITSPLLLKAVEAAYQGFLTTGRYPITVLNLSLPPRYVDINVHPTKRAIRFHREQDIFAAVCEAIRQALAEQEPLPEVRPRPSPTQPSQTTQTLWEHKEAGTDHKAPAIRPAAVTSSLPALRVLGQLATTYIIAEGPDGLYLIDQHAAHERILFEQVLAQQESAAVEVQYLLEPLPIELNARQKELLNSRQESLAQFGFTLEPFGDRTYLLRAVPAILNGQEADEVIKEVLDSPEEASALAERERSIAISIACHSAVKAGQTLSYDELRELVRQLELTTSPRHCPHGRPTMIHLSSGQLEKEFGRT